MPTADHTMELIIPKIDVREIQIRLKGVSPLICHAWSDKAKRQMLDRQMKKAKTAKESKDPFQDFCDSLYWLSEKPARPTQADVDRAVFGFPAVAFKAAAVGACRFSEGIRMTEARGAFHVTGELARLSTTPRMREDMVRVGMGTADIRYRGQFDPWSVDLVVSYNAAAISVEQIANLFRLAGFGVGCGEWRPERDGSYGRFVVE